MSAFFESRSIDWRGAPPGRGFQLFMGVPMSLRSIITRGLVPLAVVGALILSIAAPAQAASRSDSCTSWGCGSITFTFVDGNTIRPLSESVKDATCDNWHVWITLEMEYTNSSTHHFTPQILAAGCGTYTVHNSYWEASGNIRDARAVLRRSDGHKSEVFYGSWRDNPYTS